VIILYNCNKNLVARTIRDNNLGKTLIRVQNVVETFWIDKKIWELNQQAGSKIAW
jgi:hypothetical protein